MLVRPQRSEALSSIRILLKPSFFAHFGQVGKEYQRRYSEEEASNHQVRQLYGCRFGNLVRLPLGRSHGGQLASRILDSREDEGCTNDGRHYGPHRIERL